MTLDEVKRQNTGELWPPIYEVVFDCDRYHTCGAISRDGAVCRRAEGHTRYHWGDHPDPEGFGQVAWWNEDPTKWETYRWERR